MNFLRRYQHPINVAVVYILEAHASDTWPMKVEGERPCPTDLPQKINYAESFMKDMALPSHFQLRIDGMNNDFNTTFGSWPTCYYVISQDLKLQYVGECTPDSCSDSYNVAELFAFLNEMTS